MEGKEHMTRDDIIRMAREAGMEYHEAVEEMNSPMTDGVWLEDLEDFAALVAAAEREACAKLCYELMCKENPYDRWEGMKFCMDAIRARGQAWWTLIRS
jgi:hypothetical protein